MGGGQHRHPRVETVGHRLGFLQAAQFIKRDHIRCQAADRLANSLRLGKMQQYIAIVQSAARRQLAPLVHHRHPKTAILIPAGQLAHGIAQQAAFAAGRFPADQGAARSSALGYGTQQSIGAAIVRAGNTDAQRCDPTHRYHLAPLHHGAARNADPHPLPCADKSLQNLLLMAMYRIIAQLQKTALDLGVGAPHQMRYRNGGGLSLPCHQHIPVRGRQRHRRLFPQTNLVDILL